VERETGERNARSGPVLCPTQKVGERGIQKDDLGSWEMGENGSRMTWLNEKERRVKKGERNQDR